MLILLMLLQNLEIPKTVLVEMLVYLQELLRRCESCQSILTVELLTVLMEKTFCIFILSYKNGQELKKLSIQLDTLLRQDAQ